ncbi:DUF881 domain-containing protein [Solicola gregarius]|uniref:DUF881 domain-containing protein n=1 Tax=Solicola gregarius TaxID=2908642 RepID=A0AA46YJZ9_9ACTN|nr:DUF881 domain-containing protein [Solicola gregarius]UYM05145.1 DUF881 domain-containing protein [Solicola gregarius]
MSSMPESNSGSDEPTTGRVRLWRALKARPARAQIVVAVLLGVLGFAAVMQVQSVREDEDFAGYRRGDLVQLLDSLDAAHERVSADLQELNATRDRLESSTNRTKAAREAAAKEAERLSVLSGTVPVTGPGVRITITDEENAVGASTLLNAVEELRDAGAEAIQINGVVRIIAQSYFVDSDRGIRVDGRELTRPLVLDVIGDSDTLQDAVGFRGGLIDEVELVGGQAEVEEVASIDITALSDPREPEYAQPAS